MSFSLTAPRIEQQDLDREFDCMTEAEKEGAIRDLYGTGTENWIEDNDLVDTALRQLEEVLQSLPSNVTAAFHRAVVECPDYVNSREFRLLFLRSDCFDIEKAANRLVKYWDEKLILFGPDRAFRHLSFRDLDNEDRETLYAGGFNMLPGKDDSGRGILFSDRSRWESRDARRDCMVRATWYVVHALVEDEAVQRNGVVLISFSPGEFNLDCFDRKLNRKVIRTVTSILPVRIMSVHIVIRTKVAELMVPYILNSMSEQLRARYRHHCGTDEDILSELQSYGLPAQELPPGVGGNLVFNFDAWLDDRRHSEEGME